MNTDFQAQIGQLIRSEQKDEIYVNSLNEELHSIIKQLVGIRSWIHWQQTITELNKFIYYSLTTIVGSQTLGEEYCHVIPVNQDGRSVPSLAKRFMLAVFYSFNPRIVKLLINHVKQLLLFKYPKMDEAIVVDDLDFLLKSLERINRLVFFHNATYPSVSKRLLSIRYLSTINRKSSSSLNNDYSTNTLISYLNIMQLILSFYARYGTLKRLLWPSSSSQELQGGILKNQQQQQQQQHASQSKDVGEDVKHRCSLCCCTRTNPTLILCGHVFCWNCLNEWLQYKDECPVCKAKINDRQYVFLHNFC